MKVYYYDQLPEEMSQHSLAYLLLEQALKECYPGLFAEKPEYGREELGKPYIKGYPWLHFNVSHCASCVACAIGEAPVGIDAERRFPWRETLARRICHPEEWKFLQNMENLEERTAWLNRIWSRKESYLKCIGTGIRSDLRRIDTLEELKIQGFEFTELQNEEFSMAACSRENLENVQIIRYFIKRHEVP